MAVVSSCAHFNGDGFVDLAIQNGSDVMVLLGNGDGTFTFGTNLTVSLPYLYQLYLGPVAVADFDGDGKPDVLTDGSLYYRYQIFEGRIICMFPNETPPSLQIKATEGGIKLNWPDWAGYNLECSSNFPMPNGWAAVTNVPYLSGNQNVVTDTLASTSLFYRLRKP